MRRLVIILLGAVLLAGCSYSTPRYPAVYSPTEPPTAPAADGSPAAAVDTSDWIALAPQGEGFSVLMPGGATSSTGQTGTPAGNALITTWTYTDGSKRAFLVERVRFAAGGLSGAPAKTILDEATSAVAGAIPGAKVSGQSDITLSGHAGRAFTFGDLKTVVRCEIFIVGDDIYGVSVSYAAGQPDDALAQAFFDSFQLTV